MRRSTAASGHPAYGAAGAARPRPTAPGRPRRGSRAHRRAVAVLVVLVGGHRAHAAQPRRAGDGKPQSATSRRTSRDRRPRRRAARARRRAVHRRDQEQPALGLPHQGDHDDDELASSTRLRGQRHAVRHQRRLPPAHLRRQRDGTDPPGPGHGHATSRTGGTGTSRTSSPRCTGGQRPVRRGRRQPQGMRPHRPVGTGWSRTTDGTYMTGNCVPVETTH